ncbi:hypothetical protein ACFVJ8_12295 [Streptomyces yangpuensis]|uniref:hypothetical protein n=1 Tax=Streptomyces yangpuensis TaxID=1648182 RepID=UPI003645B405
MLGEEGFQPEAALAVGLVDQLGSVLLQDAEGGSARVRGFWDGRTRKPTLPGLVIGVWHDRAMSDAGLLAVEAVESHVRAFFEGHPVEVVVCDLGPERREVVPPAGFRCWPRPARR